MEQTEIASLKAEIARLNKLITILIEQNEALKEQIALASITDANLKVPLAFTNVGEGKLKVPVALANITDGNPNVPLAFVNIGEGNLKIPVALANITDGNPKVPVAFANIEEGNLKVPVAFAKIGEGNPNVRNPVLGTLTLSSINITRLRNVLKQEGFNKVRESGVKNAAMLLLHFYNNGSGDYKQLRKMTGHSNFGLAKYIRSLKKRGLIERDGWQKFKLTARSVGLIQKAGCAG